MTESPPTTTGRPAPTRPPPVPDDWVPADERVAGFDRRTIWPGVVLLVVWALWAQALGTGLILWAMFLHWFWDSTAPLFDSASWVIGLYLPLTIICLVSFIWVYRITVVKERGWARSLLAAEVDRGVITADELDAAVGSRKARKHFVKSQPSRRRTKHVLAATNDLADEIASAYAHDTPTVEHARAEIARLRA